ncbi:MAG: von Willebrand factor type A domain-containing protein [Verrucomicrobia bacterium]|nr:von Willebrand factor type A domain-containing protein [Verrucomicrobiota bacterium]
MKFQPDNPELTAYALGELDGSEAASVAAAVENSADCRQAVEETRETAGMLKSALQTESCPVLSAAQRAVINTALSSAPKVPARTKAAPAQPSFLAAVLAWRPQLATVTLWATACLVAVTGWALWLEVFCKSGRDKSQQLTGYTIRLNPKPLAPGPPPPPPPPSAASQLAMQAVVAPSAASNLILSNGVVGAWTYSGVLTASAPAMLAKPGASTSHVVNWGTFNGGLDINNNGNTFVIGGGGGTRMTGNGIMNKLGGGYATINGSSWDATAPATTTMNDSSILSLGGGNGTLTYKLGANTLILSGNNTYSGGTILCAGRLSYSGPVCINGGTLVLTNGGYSGVIGSWAYTPPPGTETYARIRDNPFLAVAEQPLSTFSIDVDTASYANVRRFLMQGSLPPRDAVRIEEMVNYFTYDYAKPKRSEPFSVNIEAAGCPWNAGHRLVRIGLKSREVSAAKRPPCNLVFLIDVSGSMADANKLSLIKPAMRMLVEQLTENERVAIVVYNRSARVVLHSTSGDRKQEIIDAIESLQANGSTNGGDGIRLAYDMATRHFIERGVNRVILCTDGDFNVGTTELADLTRLIEQKRKSGVFLSVLGFGAGNLKDATLERLADKGNGHYTYIDTFFEARKVLVEQMNSTLVTIAKDVKIQVEFNPTKVAGYRLIGYEDRLLAKEDFNNDRKDAGEIGAGHSVTALYEIVPAGQPLPTPAVDPLKYQPAPKPTAPVSDNNELLTVKLRYKQPDGDKSALIEQSLTDGDKSYATASRDFKFAAAVAEFGMVLRDSEHKGNATLAAVLELAEESRGPDSSGYRTEFLSLVKKAQALGKK